MRTTVTLDSDVETLLQEAMKREGKSFKQVLNESLRSALEGRGGEAEPEFVVAARPLGLRVGIDPARIRDLDDDLEVAEFQRKTVSLQANLNSKSP